MNYGKYKSWWGESYAGVCQKPYQFSYRNRNDPNYQFLSGAQQIPAAGFAKCQLAAQQIIEGFKPDPIGRATLSRSTSMPKPPK